MFSQVMDQRILVVFVMILAVIPAVVAAEFQVSETSDWNQGSFDGTSAEKISSEGKLEIGYRNGTAADSLLGYWRMDSTSGNVTDYSGNLNEGMPFGEVQRGKGGIFGSSAFSFDGTDDYIALPMSYDSTNIGSFSVSAWVKIPENGGDWSVVDFDRSEYFSTSVGIKDDEINGEGNYVGFHSTDSTGSTSDMWSRTSVRDEDWHHVAWVFDGSTKYIYIDGRLDRTQSVSGIGSGDFKRYGFIGDGSEADTFNGSRNDIHYKGELDEVRFYDTAISKGAVWKLYTAGREYTSGMLSRPERYYPVDTASSPLLDVSGSSDHGELDLLGEAGTITTSGGWETIRFERSYENPVVIGTANTHNGEAGISFEARNIQSDQAEIRICESEGGSSTGCDSHVSEKVGYVVINAAATDRIPGIEAGTFSIDSDFDSNTKTISYSESFSSAPYLMANVQSDNGKKPLEARVRGYSASDFTAGICHQDSTDGCDSGHTSEEVGWVAVEPGNLPFEQLSETGSTGNSVSSSSWTQQSFGTEFSNTPVTVVSTVSNDGGQDNLIDEARNVDTSGLEVRYCEVETGDSCDTHTTEEVAWLAVEPGLLTYTSGNFPRYVNSQRGKALEFDGQDDYVQVPDFTLESSSSTIMGSFYIDDFTPSNDRDDEVMFVKYNGESTNQYIGFGRTNLSFETNVNNEGGGTIQSDRIKAQDWFQAALVFEGGTASLYVDGKYEGSVSLEGNDLTVDQLGYTMGSSTYQEGYPSWYDGEMKDIRVYNRALSLEEIQTRYFNGSTLAGDYTSERIDTGSSEWSSLEVNSSLPQGTDVDAVFRALDSSGNVVESQVLDLENGKRNYTLEVSGGNKAEVIFNGSSRGLEKTWSIDGFSVFGGFCDFRGTRDQCVVNSTRQLQPDTYSVDSTFNSSESSVLKGLNGLVTLNVSNSSFVSGIWRGAFEISSKPVTIQPGAEFRPENGDIIIGE